MTKTFCDFCEKETKDGHFKFGMFSHDYSKMTYLAPFYPTEHICPECGEKIEKFIDLLKSKELHEKPLGDFLEDVLLNKIIIGEHGNADRPRRVIILK